MFGNITFYFSGDNVPKYLSYITKHKSLPTYNQDYQLHVRKVTNNQVILPAHKGYHVEWVLGEEPCPSVEVFRGLDGFLEGSQKHHSRGWCSHSRKEYLCKYVKYKFQYLNRVMNYNGDT